MLDESDTEHIETVDNNDNEKLREKGKVARHLFNRMCLEDLWKEGEEKMHKKNIRKNRERMKTFQDEDEVYYTELYNSLKNEEIEDEFDFFNKTAEDLPSWRIKISAEENVSGK